MDETVAAKPLLNRLEQLLYGRLVRAFPGHVVLAHVALSRLLAAGAAGAASAASAAATHTTTSRFRGLVADFLVCRPDFTALAVVELDHAKARDAQRGKDLRKTQLLHAAGIKVVHLPAHDIPKEAALKALVASLPLHSSTSQLLRRAS